MKMSKISILVNDREKKISPTTSLGDLLDNLKIDIEQKGIACAINFKVIKKEHWHTTYLKQNDRINIFEAVQGG